MELFVGILVVGGFIVSSVVIRARAGVGQGRIRVFGKHGFGLVWVMMAMLASFFWPITLAMWLARGRPEPRVVFNKKAEERQRAATTVREG